MINKKKNIFLSKIYLLSYSFFIFAMFFSKDSQICGGGIGVSGSKGMLGPFVPIIYYMAFSFVILVSIFLNVKSFKGTSIFLIFSSLGLILLSLKYPIISSSFFILLIFFSNLRFVDVKKFIKCDFITRIYSFTFIIICYITHIFPSASPVNRGNVLRYSLGFNHPNELGVISLSLMISGFIYSRQFSKAKYIYFLFISIIFYIIISKLSYSREFIVCGLLIILAIFFQRIALFNNIFKALAIPSIIISLFLYIFLLFYLNKTSPIYLFMNNISSGRLNSQTEAIMLYPIKWCGYKDTGLLYNGINSLNSGNYIAVDNIYITLLLKCGIVGLIIYELFFVSLPFIIHKMHYDFLYVLVVILSIYAILGSSNDLLFVFMVIYLYFYSYCKKLNKLRD